MQRDMCMHPISTRSFSNAQFQINETLLSELMMDVTASRFLTDMRAQQCEPVALHEVYK